MSVGVVTVASVIEGGVVLAEPCYVALYQSWGIKIKSSLSQSAVILIMNIYLGISWFAYYRCRGRRNEGSANYGNEI